MTDALGGAAVAKPTLAEQANAQRIGRARFIGNAVGIAILLGAVVVGVTILAGIMTAASADPQSAMLTTRRVTAVVGGAMFNLALLDLGVRRRHDRGRSGVDCVVALIILEGLSIASIFERVPPGIPMIAVAAAAGLISLYLLVVLALLPSAKGNNAYGPPPYVEHR